MKYKLLVLLILMPITALGLYLYMAKNLFENDKIAYIFGTSLSSSKMQAHTVENEFKIIGQINRPILVGYSRETKKFDKISMTIFNETKSLNILRLYEENIDGDYKKVGELKKEDFFMDDHIDEVGNIELEFAKIEVGELSVKILSLEKGLFAVFTKFERQNSTPIGVFNVQTSQELVNPFITRSFFSTYLINKHGKVLLGPKDQKLLEKDLANTDIYKRLKGIKTREGTFEEKIKTDNYLVSFTQVNTGNLTVLTLMSKSIALSAVGTLIMKSLLFLIAIVAFSIVIALIASKKLTSTLRELFFATKEIGKGNFDIEVKEKSHDEVGELAKSFNFMGKEISRLLKELKKYSEHLEELVEERTRELNEALSLQKGMMDSLGQGFMMFDEAGTVLPVFSKASEKMFERSPAGEFVGDLLQIPENEKETFKNFCQFIYAETIPFEDIANLAPKKIENSSHRKIFLDYHEMRNQDQKISNVVIVATDKTDEVAAQEEAKKEKAYVEMIVKILSNKGQFSNFLLDTRKTLQEMNNCCLSTKMTNTEKIDALFRGMHTIKGNSGLFSLYDIKNTTHEYENELDKLKAKDDKEQTGFIVNLPEKLKVVEDLFDKFISDHGRVLGLQSWKEFTPTQEIQIEKLKIFLDLLNKVKAPKGVIQRFVDNIYARPCTSLLSHYNDLIQNLAQQLGKKVKPLIINGGETRVIPELYNDLFSSLVHAFRNSIDHGIELPEIRESNGKLEEGQLSLTISKIPDLNGNEELLILLEDDGKGIDPDVIRSLVKNKNPELAQKESDEEIIQHVFDASLSTNEEVTDLSGRGVGMDAIKNITVKMGGTVEVRSKVGKGTINIIRVPLQEKIN
ncbi:MAG: Hpt domain-containing protein [Halobacteriovoraceae bacterium]|nr:Hpt domain-containing protein [Halobacteriovoraceae bacterium]